VPASEKKVVTSKFPLRLMPSVRRIAESFSQREGVSLNQFINLAVAEKVAHLQHEEWVARRPKAVGALLAKALDVLNRPAGQPPENFDMIPNGYKSSRRNSSGKRATADRQKG
jgi:hypothetical protein